jgi:hypothetical protein
MYAVINAVSHSVIVLILVNYVASRSMMMRLGALLDLLLLEEFINNAKTIVKKASVIG